MQKILSLIKANMTENMSIFRVKNKHQSKFQKRMIPIILFALIFLVMWSYANMFMEQLDKANMEFVGLTIFVFITTIMTLVEGIYKSSNLLFNCKDDDLLFSLPINKSSVFFIRIIKFYIFELLYNSMFLIPAMVAYIRWTNVSFTYYIVSFLGLILFPMIPIAISCVIGMFISSVSSKFKKRNIVQIVVTTLFLLGVLYLSFNLDGLMIKISENASSINDMITRLYYPAGLYIKLINDFNIMDLVIFIGINVLLFGFTTIVLSNRYFKINSNVKTIKSRSSEKKYKIKTNKPIISLIKKELTRFATSPVFVTNAGFGLVLFIIACIMMVLKFESIGNPLAEQMKISIEQLKLYMPLVLLVFIIFTSLLTSITSSMISLEGKTFSILKSLPVNPYTVIKAKILTAVLIMIPCILIGDSIVIAKFGCNILELIMILVSSIVLPLVSATIGIAVNLKFPKMDATNDTEIVKQSMSSSIAVFTGIGLMGLTILAIFKAITLNIQIDIIMAMLLGIYVLLYVFLLIYMKKTGVKRFNEIIV